MDCTASAPQSVASRDFEALLTPDEAARMLNVEPVTLAAWRMQHRALPFVKIGRLVRYRPADVRQLIEASLQEAA
jgi:excisionase family DNA binding protein